MIAPIAAFRAVSFASFALRLDASCKLPLTPFAGVNIALPSAS